MNGLAKGDLLQSSLVKGDLSQASPFGRLALRTCH